MIRQAKANLIAGAIQRALKQIDGKADPSQWYTSPVAVDIGFLPERVARRPALVIELASYDARPRSGEADRRVHMAWNVHCCSEAEPLQAHEELNNMARDVARAIASMSDLTDEAMGWLAWCDYDSIRYEPQFEVMNRSQQFGLTTVSFESLSPWTADAP